MTKKINQIRVFISSPSDVNTERQEAQEIIDELNTTLGESNGFVLYPLTWEKNTYPSVGTYSQEVINKQIVDYDIFVGIMSNRFGSPTPKANSGTEEEFNYAYEKRENVQIMFFFKNAQIMSNDVDIEQLQKVRKFKEEIANKGVYYREFTNDFKKVFREDLTKYISDKYISKNENINIDNSHIAIQLNQEFDKYLHSTDTFFTHPSGEDLSLDNIYVPQNLKIISENNKNDKRTNIADLTDAIDIDGIHYYIIGGERSGKSALCKYTFCKYFYKNNLTPILMNGSDLSSNTRRDKILQIIIDKYK